MFLLDLECEVGGGIVEREGGGVNMGFECRDGMFWLGLGEEWGGRNCVFEVQDGIF